MSAHHPSNDDPNRDRSHRDTTAPSDDSPDVPFTTGPLVDALSSGAPAPDDDELAHILAGWRDDLSTGLDTSTTTTPRSGADDRLAAVVDLRSKHKPHRTGRSIARVAVAGVATIAALAGTAGVCTASWNSSPTSALWPVARVLFPEHARVVEIEQTIGQAREALCSGDLTQAAYLVNTARQQLTDANELPDAVAEKLRAQIDALVAELLSLLATPTPPAPRPPAPQHTGPPAPEAPTTAASTPTPRPPAKTTPPPKRPLIEDGGLLPALPLPQLPFLTSPTPTPSPTPKPSKKETPAPVLPDVDDVLPDIRIKVDITVGDPTEPLGLCTSSKAISLRPTCKD